MDQQGHSCRQFIAPYFSSKTTISTNKNVHKIRKLSRLTKTFAHLLCENESNYLIASSNFKPGVNISKPVTLWFSVGKMLSPCSSKLCWGSLGDHQWNWRWFKSMICSFLQPHWSHILILWTHTLEIRYLALHIYMQTHPLCAPSPTTMQDRCGNLQVIHEHPWWQYQQLRCAKSSKILGIHDFASL